MQLNSRDVPTYFYLFVFISSTVSRCRRTLRGEGHSAAGWGIGGSVWLQTAGSKVRSFEQWAAATCAAPLVSLPVSAPLRIVNRCWPGFPCKWRYINIETFIHKYRYWYWVLESLEANIIGYWILGAFLGIVLTLVTINKKLSYRRETARQLRIHAQLTRCFSEVAV